MDESDVFIYNNPNEFKRYLSSVNQCICFTATLHGAEIELQILDAL